MLFNYNFFCCCCCCNPLCATLRKCNFINDLITLLWTRSLRNNRTRMHFNLFVAMMIQLMVRLTLYIDQYITRKTQQRTTGIDNTVSLTVRSTSAAVFWSWSKFSCSQIKLSCPQLSSPALTYILSLSGKSLWSHPSPSRHNYTFFVSSILSCPQVRPIDFIHSLLHNLVGTLTCVISMNERKNKTKVSMLNQDASG